jgi:uncharacterized membrane protein
MLAMAASVEAIFLSTFILISQNRMQRLADRRAELDLQISLLTEHELTRAIQLLDEVAPPARRRPAGRARVARDQAGRAAGQRGAGDRAGRGTGRDRRGRKVPSSRRSTTCASSRFRGRAGR